MKKVVILVNKEFEYKGFKEGIESVLSNAELARRVSLREDNIDLQKTIKKKPLETYVFENLKVDVYCIQYLFPKGENSSNSEAKFNYLKNLLGKELKLEDIDYVMSFSTSESTPESQQMFGYKPDGSVNGCVFVGNRFFLSDRHDNDPTSPSRLVIGNPASGKTEYYEDPVIHDLLYAKINKAPITLKPVPFASAANLICYAGSDFACVGVVNVMDYNAYEKADEAAYNLFKDLSAKENYRIPMCIETTHGVVKKALDFVQKEKSYAKEIPVMFISPITDRYKHFKDDVQGDQNHICSYNGGVATGHILKILNKLLGHTNK